jgi:glutamate-1-semialdehyde 2,1-aminomutase
MTAPVERRARQSVIDRYAGRTPGSAALLERAARVLPGGSTRTTTFSEPYPPYIASGAGAVLTDVDGNTYLDFLGNYTSLILGHAHPAVVAAVEAQLRRGSAFAAPTELEIELAEEIVGRVPSIERVRFSNSGTEATMFALRLARAHTGRDVVARFAGAYHGTHDLAMAGSLGVPARLAELMVDLPFNDMAGVERALAGREREVAAIIIEPVQGVAGMVPADPGFLAELRAYTRRHGMLLVFDEVITFRVARGGAQEVYGVRPDLTALGKIIGGGHPVGAFGGGAEIMDRLDARRPDALVHGGTFNGNPITMAAGLATLRQLTPPTYERLAALGDRLRDGLTAGFASAGLDARVTGLASLFQVHLGSGAEDAGSMATGRTDGDPAAMAASKARAARFHLGMLVAGFLTAPRGMGALMTPLDEADIDAFVAAAVVAAAEALESPARD